MRIKVVVPVSTDLWNEMIREQYERYKDPGTEIDIVNIKKGPESITCTYDVVWAELFALREAEKAYMEAIRLNPENPVVHYNLGLVYLELGERDRAFDEYRILKSLDSEEYAEKLFKEIYREKDE